MHRGPGDRERDAHVQPFRERLRPRGRSAICSRGMRHTSFGWSLAPLLSVTFACSSNAIPAPAANDAGATDAAQDVVAADVAGRTPSLHRASASACPAARPPGTCTHGTGCVDDSACINGTNGRCIDNLHLCVCSYDKCATDADCATGGPCDCRATSVGANQSNVCLPGNCRVDADCGAGGFCSPTYGAACGPSFGVAGYWCHTKDDACLDDADCTTPTKAGYCEWSGAAKHWVCGYGVCPP